MDFEPDDCLPGRHDPATLARSARVSALIELEHDLALPNESELFAGNALDGLRIFTKVLYLRAQLRDVATQLGVLGLYAGKLLLEGAHARHALGLEDEHGDGHQ
jgi:hypothetical protein